MRVHGKFCHFEHRKKRLDKDCHEVYRVSPLASADVGCYIQQLLTMISPAAAMPYPGLACFLEHSWFARDYFTFLGRASYLRGIHVYLLQAGNGFLQLDPLLSLVHIWDTFMDR